MDRRSDETVTIQPGSFRTLDLFPTNEVRARNGIVFKKGDRFGLPLHFTV